MPGVQTDIGGSGKKQGKAADAAPHSRQGQGQPDGVSPAAVLLGAVGQSHDGKQRFHWEAPLTMGRKGRVGENGRDFGPQMTLRVGIVDIIAHILEK